MQYYALFRFIILKLTESNRHW